MKRFTVYFKGKRRIMLRILRTPEKRRTKRRINLIYKT